jgi:NTP pyrophosphatase (non-canonical NTP hydrolase)
MAGWEKRAAIYKRAHEKAGLQFQANIFIEEAAELVQALMKNINRGKDNLDNLKEEIADVLVGVEQIVVSYGFDIAQIEAIRDAKLERIEGKLQESLENKKP